MYLTLDIGEQQLRACNMYLTLPYLHKRERERESSALRIHIYIYMYLQPTDRKELTVSWYIP